VRGGRGIALAELLVSMAVGVTLVLTAATLHARVLRLASDAGRLAEAQDALRIALAVLDHDLRHAGFWGLVPTASRVQGRTDDPAASPIPVISDCGDRWATDLARHVQAFDGPWPLGCSPNGGLVAGSSVLVLRRAAVMTSSTDAGVLQLASDRWTGRLFADGSGMAGEEVEVRDLVARAYYVSPRSTGDAGTPSLRRKTLQRGPRVVDEEVVPGIGSLEVFLGLDEDAPGASGHGVPDRFVAPGTAATGEVVAVRFRLSAHGPETLSAERTVRLQEPARW
jgi:type IV pilus assembly protein PilW